MSSIVRERRRAFLLFLGACFVALMTALPIVTAQAQREVAKKETSSAAAGPSADSPDFDRTDRNRDGIVDKSEAGGVPGLSANFERADRNKDGRLDRGSTPRAPRILQADKWH
jgi:hypothetical protein